MSNHTATVSESSRVFHFILDELKPRGPWLTPFNVISIPIILVGLVILYYRFRYGLGSVPLWVSWLAMFATALLAAWGYSLLGARGRRGHA